MSAVEERLSLVDDHIVLSRQSAKREPSAHADYNNNNNVSVGECRVKKRVVVAGCGALLKLTSKGADGNDRVGSCGNTTIDITIGRE